MPPSSRAGAPAIQSSLQTARLTDTGALDDAELAAMDGRVLRQIEEALAFAQASPWPEPQTLIDYVYA